MRRFVYALAALTLFAAVSTPVPAAAEVEKAVIDILGGMQCSL